MRLGAFRAVTYPSIRDYQATLAPGRARRVGSVSGFGVSVFDPRGIASHDGVLYMVAGRRHASNGAFYRLNSTNGVATLIANAPFENIGGQLFRAVPTGLASHGGSLYVVSEEADRLYTIDPATGGWARVGSADDFGVGETAPAGLASYNGTLYMVGSTRGRLFTLNPTTGVASTVGTATDFGVGEGVPTGIASHRGQFYMVGSQTDALYIVGVSSFQAGFASRIGSETAFGVGETRPQGLTSHNRKLYMVGSTANALYTIEDAG